MKMNMLTQYYYLCAGILKDQLPCIPKLKLSEAKGYCGRIHHNLEKEEYTIYLSKHNLDCGPIGWWDKEDYEELIDTICHEFAHLYFWPHGEDHTEVTKQMKIVVNSTLEIWKNEEYLNEIMEVC